MDISDLQILQLLLSEQSISRVANVMNLSQPAVTIRLGKMRDRFKDELLIRDGNNMLLTNKAKSLIKPLQNILDDIDYLIPAEEFIPEKTAATFKLYVSEHFSYLGLTSLLQQINKTNPNHIINVRTFPVIYQIQQKFDFTHADLVVGILNNLDSFNAELLFEDSLVIGYRNYPLPEKLDYDTYINLPHMLFSFDDDHNKFLHYLTRPDPRNIYSRVSTLSAALEIMDDQCIIVTANSLAKRFNLNTAPLPFETKPVMLQAFYPQRLKYDAKNKWLRQLCKEITQQETQRILNG
ncbi:MULTISPECIES: LysR family transcriptional regulator [Cysteiniphilum]|uniref:LysR family transcriptional regulator n=1 Tax=Cysteiniphilum TaxID=2056696 RepID=UPI0017843C74|nr:MULTISPECIES: LysR family transcriptional regulator [Cysteiniphilum]